MVDDPISGMRQKVALATGGFAILIVVLVALAFGGRPVWDALVSLSTGSSSGATAAASLSGIALAIGYILVTFDIQGVVDRRLFHAVTAVNEGIVDRLRSEVKRFLPDAQPTARDLMGLFYEFANRDDGSWPMLRGIAFDRWTPYHSAMNCFVVACSGLVLSVTSIWYRGVFDIYNGVPLLFTLSAALLSVYLSQRVLRPKLLTGVAEPEIVKMTRDLSTEFEKLATARFGVRKSNP